MAKPVNAIYLDSDVDIARWIYTGASGEVDAGCDVEAQIRFACMRLTMITLLIRLSVMIYI